MALLKSYSCVKCGGVLNFDEGQEVFGCPFCGGEFAFTDFHRGDLLKQASSSLASGNYRTAADKYSTILNSNPRDFEALQGLVLSCGKIPSTDLLEQIDNLDKADFKGGVKAALDAKEMLKEEAEYFTLLADMFSAAGEYFQKKESYDEHTDRIRKGYREMILVSTGVGETVSKVMGIIGLSAFVLWFVFFIASLIADNFWPLVIGLGALVVSILLVFVIAKIVTNSTLKKKAEQLSLSQESDLPLSAEMNNYKFAYYVTYRDFKKLSPNADALPSIAERSKAKAMSASFFILAIVKSHRVHECALHTIEDYDAYGQQHNHEGEAVAQHAPAELTLTQHAVFKCLGDASQRVEAHDHPQLGVGDGAQGVDDWGGVHP